MKAELRRKPLHPGEILREQFMAEFGLSINRLARDLRVPVTRIAEIVHERRSVTPDTAFRLATTWMQPGRLQVPSGGTSVPCEQPKRGRPEAVRLRLVVGELLEQDLGRPFRGLADHCGALALDLGPDVRADYVPPSFDKLVVDL